LVKFVAFVALADVTFRLPEPTQPTDSRMTIAKARGTSLVIPPRTYGVERELFRILSRPIIYKGSVSI
jgi:hypothetical protein